jgi:hypothetical protein
MHLTSTATRLLALAAALFALALVGAGCGSDDEGSEASGPEGEVTAVVEESVAFEDPATVCEENFTEKALEDNYEGKDLDALIEDCSNDDPSETTEIDVSNVEVKGDSATADVSVTEDDETFDFTAELVKEEGIWKIDGVK